MYTHRVLSAFKKGYSFNNKKLRKICETWYKQYKIKSVAQFRYNWDLYIFYKSNCIVSLVKKIPWGVRSLDLFIEVNFIKMYSIELFNSRILKMYT